MVYVKSKDGKALMPTSNAKARKLLKQKDSGFTHKFIKSRKNSYFFIFSNNFNNFLIFLKFI